MQQSGNFFDHSITVAERFLQTAVVIDDRAFRKGELVEPLPEPILPPPTPSTISGQGTLFVEILPISTPELAIIPIADPDPHALDAQSVIESFAHRGIVCSVLQRVPEECSKEPGKRARVIDPADILVIDWQIHLQDGSDST